MDSPSFKSLIYYCVNSLCRDCQAWKKGFMTFKMNNDVRKTYSIVCHSAMSKYFVSGRDDSDSENRVGVVLWCRRTFQNYCLTFGHLGLRLIPWPHILMYLIVRVLFSLGLWLVSWPQLMCSLHSSEPKLLLLII